jgi:hypothetical protein
MTTAGIRRFNLSTAHGADPDRGFSRHFAPRLSPVGQYRCGSVVVRSCPPFKRNRTMWRWAMQQELSSLDRLQLTYKAAVDEWVIAIREEEALASVNHSVAEVDQWEAAHFREDELRSKVKAAKKEYEDGLRQEFFGI